MAVYVCIWFEDGLQFRVEREPFDLGELKPPWLHRYLHQKRAPSRVFECFLFLQLYDDICWLRRHRSEDSGLHWRIRLSRQVSPASAKE